MKTTITHNTTAERRSLYTGSDWGNHGVDVTPEQLDGVHQLRVSVQHDADGEPVVEIYAHAEREPKPIPMSDMPIGSIGQIANWGFPEKIGQWVRRIGTDKWVTLDGEPSTLSKPSDTSTVRLLQPGESLAITCEGEPLPDGDARGCDKCANCKQPTDTGPCFRCQGTFEHPHFEPRFVDAEPETPAEPDDQFERLADRVTRKECTNCGNDPTGSRCLNDDGPCLVEDPRGYGGQAHPRWKPIESTLEPTLSDALQHGGAEAIVAALGTSDDNHVKWGKLMAAVSDIDPTVDRIVNLVQRADESYEDDCRCLAVAFVELRDRLGLKVEVTDENGE